MFPKYFKQRKHHLSLELPKGGNLKITLVRLKFAKNKFWFLKKQYYQSLTILFKIKKKKKTVIKEK